MNAQPFEEMADVGPVFTAQFTSDCDHCEFKIKLGDQARYSDGDVIHVVCPKPREVCTTCWLLHGTHQEECE